MVQHVLSLRAIALVSLLALPSYGKDSEANDSAITILRFPFTSAGRPSFVQLLEFDRATHSLKIIDNGPDRSNPRFKNLSDALHRERCVAGINGGFFVVSTFAPEGLLIASGERLSETSTKTWLAGFLLATEGTPSIETRSEFAEETIHSDALQSGPWLVLDGATANLANSDDAPVRRTFVATTEDGRIALGYCERSTLEELANILTSPAMQTIFPTHRALNLDGGPSTGMISLEPSAPFAMPEMWTVRNYIAIVRSPTKADK